MTISGPAGRPRQKGVTGMARETQLLAALEAIETIVGDDDCTEWEMLAVNKRLRGKAKLMESKLADIYKIAHAYNPSHSCYDVHSDWRELVTEAQA